MQELKVCDLKPHPRNDYFFDDIQGDNWKDFLKSIEERGVIEPIVVTQDLIVVSGHQRVRACKELGKESIMTDMRNYQNEDDILRDLIDTNLKQRGVGNPNPIKLGRCIIELERIYGIRNGSAGKRSLDGNNFPLKTQEDLSEQFHLTAKQLRSYKKLAESSPEIQDMLENGVIKPTVAIKIVTCMSEEEQEEFFKQNDISKKITQKQVEKYLEIERKRFKKEKRELENQLAYEKNKKQEVEIKVVDNTDYETIERLESELKTKTDFYNKIVEREKSHSKLMEMYKHDSDEYKKLRRDVESLTRQKNSLSRDMATIEELTPFIHNVNKLIKNELAPTKYTKAFKEAYYIDVIQNNLMDMVNLVQDWCNEIKNELNVSQDDKDIINVKFEEEM